MAQYRDARCSVPTASAATSTTNKKSAPTQLQPSTAPRSAADILDAEKARIASRRSAQIMQPPLATSSTNTAARGSSGPHVRAAASNLELVIGDTDDEEAGHNETFSSSRHTHLVASNVPALAAHVIDVIKLIY